MLRKSDFEFTDNQLVNLIRELEANGLLKLHPPDSGSFLRFLVDFTRLWWMYAALLISTVETSLVLFASQVSAITPVRSVLGLGMLGIVPGYVTLRAVLLEERLSVLEQLSLSIFLSVSISVTLGIALGVRPLFDAANSIFALSVYTESMAVFGAYRFHKRERLPSLRNVSSSS